MDGVVVHKQELAVVEGSNIAVLELEERNGRD